MLTDTKIRNLKPSDKCTTKRPDKYSDTDGLQLLVRVTGSKVWVKSYRFNNKQQTVTLGKYPEISLAQAREISGTIKSNLVKGIDQATHTYRLHAPQVCHHLLNKSIHRLPQACARL